MTVSASSRAANLGRSRLALWAILGVLVLLPAIAMLFTDEVRWTGADFIAAAAIFAVFACAIELIVRFVDRSVSRLACRVYTTPDGLGGSPTVVQFMEVLS